MKFTLIFLVVVFCITTCIIVSHYHKQNIELQNQNWQQSLKAAQLFKSTPDQTALFLNRNKLSFRTLNMSSLNQQGESRYLMIIANAEPITTFDWRDGIRHRRRQLQFEFADRSLFCYAVETPNTLF